MTDMNNTNAMLQDMIARRASEMVQQVLFPHELERLVESGFNEMESTDVMSEEQQKLVRDIYHNHLITEDDTETLQNLHTMVIGDNVYALANAEDIVLLQDSLQRGIVDFEEQLANGEDVSEELDQLRLTQITDTGRASQEDIQLVIDSGAALMGIIILPVRLRGVSDNCEVVH